MLPVLRNAESWALVTWRYSASLVELLEGLLLADPKERWSAERAYSFVVFQLAGYRAPAVLFTMCVCL